jgi:glycosyltransferase 2 family protein
MAVLCRRQYICVQALNSAKIPLSMSFSKFKHMPWRKRLSDPTTQLVLAIALFVVSAILVSDNRMAAWEKTVFNAVYGLPNGFTPIFLMFTQLGNITILLALAVIMLIKKHYSIVIRMLMAGLLAEILAHIGKGLVGRPRPIAYIADLVLRDPTYGVGFPSGHTAVATAIALVSWHYLPKGYKWVTPVWITGVALSRMYLGVHAPMDLIGGFAIGWASFALFKHVSLRDIRR